MTFGEKLQRLRSREGISQDRLAELLDVSRQAVSKWERDETMPEAEKIVRISDYFHVFFFHSSTSYSCCSNSYTTCHKRTSRIIWNSIFI